VSFSVPEEDGRRNNELFKAAPDILPFVHTSSAVGGGWIVDILVAEETSDVDFDIIAGEFPPFFSGKSTMRFVVISIGDGRFVFVVISIGDGRFVLTPLE